MISALNLLFGVQVGSKSGGTDTIGVGGKFLKFARMLRIMRVMRILRFFPGIRLMFTMESIFYSIGPHIPPGREEGNGKGEDR